MPDFSKSIIDEMNEQNLRELIAETKAQFNKQEFTLIERAFDYVATHAVDNSTEYVRSQMIVKMTQMLGLS